MVDNVLLKEIGLMANSLRPSLPKYLNSTLLRESESFARLWIRSMGCTHSITNGGCVACDYWIGVSPSPEAQYEGFIREINILAKNPPKTLLVNTNGSFFDENELCRENRIKFFSEIIEKLPHTIIVFETRAETINKQVIKDLEGFSSDKVIIEMGIETATQGVNSLCCNKKLNLDIIPQTISLLQSAKIKTFANVMIGLPFLTSAEIVSEALKTIDWCFKIGFTGCVLFPINIKPFTALNWLHKHNYYEEVSLWALIEILNRLNSNQIRNIEISWCPNLKQNQQPLYNETTILPTTCPNCIDQVNGHLTIFANCKEERAYALTMINLIDCSCKYNWNKSLNTDSISKPFINRIEQTFYNIAREALGEDWLNLNKQKMLNQISILAGMKI